MPAQITHGESRLKALLDDWEHAAPDKAPIVQQVRKLVRRLYPGVEERVMFGGVMFSLAIDFSGIFVCKAHVSMEFGRGALMQDPDCLLEGKGKLRRHIKLRAPEDINNRQLIFYLPQAVAIS